MVCSLFVVQSSLVDFWEKGRLVTVTVKALGVKKPDRTRLSNTTAQANCLCPKMEGSDI